jgi:SCY1-like protein 1
LFYIAENFLDKATVGVQLGKVIGILFKVNDRAIRGTLLQKAPFMAESFDKNTLNEAVFEPMCSGFSDSSAALRELTLKATAALVPHLTHPNLEKLSRYLVRLQSDPESSIRTNTVIFFSRLAPYLTETTRQKMLLPAFVRAMKDPFTPCRLAALKSTLKAKEFFDPMGIASRVMPAITPQLLDPSAEVRREAFTAVDDLLFVLRQESERLSRLPEPASAPMHPASAAQTRPAAATTQSAAPQPEAPRSGGFSLGGISSWMTSKATPEPSPQSAPSSAVQPRAVASHVSPRPVVPHMPMQPRPGLPLAPSMAMNNMNLNESEDWGDADGWDDDNDVDLDVSAGGVKVGGAPAPAASGSLFAVSAPVPPPAAYGSLFAPAASEDDFFGGFDAKPAKPVAMRTMGGGGKLVVPPKKAAAKTAAAAKAAVKKLSAEESVSDGWDDF